MRTLCFTASLLLAATTAGAQTFPARGVTAVVDAAHVLTPEQARSLEGRLADYQHRTGHGLVVATLPSLQGYPIADYGYRLGRAWGVGQRGRNDGAILLLAPNERQVRIEVGYGLEGDLTDARASRIVRDVVAPKLRSGDIAGGLGAGVDEIIGTAPSGATVPPDASAAQHRSEALATLINALVALALIGGLSALILALIRRRDRASRKAQHDDPDAARASWTSEPARGVAGDGAAIHPASFDGGLSAMRFDRDRSTPAGLHQATAATAGTPASHDWPIAPLIAGAALAAAASTSDDAASTIDDRSDRLAVWEPPASPSFEPSPSAYDSGSTGSVDYGGGSFGGGCADTSY